MNYKRCRAKKQDFSEFSFFFARRGVFSPFFREGGGNTFYPRRPGKESPCGSRGLLFPKNNLTEAAGKHKIRTVKKWETAKGFLFREPFIKP